MAIGVLRVLREFSLASCLSSVVHGHTYSLYRLHYICIYVWVDISTTCSSTSFYTIDYYSLCQCTRRYVGSKARFLLLLLCHAIVVWATVFWVFSICRFFLVLDDVGGGIVGVCQGGVGDARLSVGLAGLLKHVVEEVRVNFL